MTRSRISDDKLADGRAFIESVAASPEAKAFYGPLPQATKGHVGKALLFGILTANERTDKAEAALPIAWGFLQNMDVSLAQLQQELKDVGLMFYRNKALYIQGLRWQWHTNPTPMHPVPGESCSEYRDRLVSYNLPGLGFVKTSFAAYLAYGGGNVICADRHILNLYTNGQFKDTMHKGSKKAVELLRQVETYFVNMAKLYDWPSASALQWAVWCEALQTPLTHNVVSADSDPELLPSQSHNGGVM